MGSGEEASGSARTDATAALKPFLHEHAAHFWHELRCGPELVLHMKCHAAMVHVTWSYRALSIPLFT